MKSSNTTSVVVLCTAPDEATARFSRQSAGGKLAACATLIPGATSLYYWEGKLEQEYEVQMILKLPYLTSRRCWNA